MANGICADCGQKIPAYLEVGAGGVGFVSPLSDDVPGSAVLSEVEGKPAWMGVERQVCMPCYVKAWDQKYPDVPCYLTEKATFIHEDMDRAKMLGLVS